VSHLPPPGVLVLGLAVGALAAFVLWSFIDGLVLDPPRARRRFNAIAAALGLTPIDEPDDRRHVVVETGGRVMTMRAVHVGGPDASVRGAQGRLWIVETPLRVSRWEMHDVQIRPRRRDGDFDRRFAVRESGVPVREGWLTPPVQAALVACFDNPLATGTLRVDRGLLQHVVSWSRVPDQPAPGDVRALVDRLAAVADAFDTTASRRHPMT
jgi:hypothetical protein